MGNIVSSKKQGNKVIVEIEMSYNEYLQLQGSMKRVHLFSEENLGIKTNLSQRGRNEATKYFLIPKDFRNGLQFNEKVTCQKLDTGVKTIFVYLVDKVNL